MRGLLKASTIILHNAGLAYTEAKFAQGSKPSSGSEHCAFVLLPLELVPEGMPASHPSRVAW